MVTDQQVRRLFKMSQELGITKLQAAMKAGMHEQTARKYLKAGKLPSEVQKEHHWTTRQNPFAVVWDESSEKLESNPGFEAKTLFEYLKR